jgi:hypothetical protein
MRFSTSVWPYALLLGVSAAIGCSARPPEQPHFVEGTIALAPAPSAELFNDSTTPPALDSADVERLRRRFAGLRVVVGKQAGQLAVISPLAAEWRRLDGSVDWVAPATATDPAASRQECLTSTDPKGCLEEHLSETISAIQSEYRDIAYRPTNREASLSRVGAQLDSIVQAVSLNAAAVAAPDRGRFLRVAALARATQLDPTGVQKAYLGGTERSPAFYNAVWRNSKTAAAVKDVSDRIGTGFLVTPEWLVTCRHVVNRRDRHFLKVVFDYEEDELGHPGHATECAVAADPVIATESHLDLAALRLGSCTTPPSPPLTNRVVQFNARIPRLDEPVYVVGHPHGNFKMVADNARLRYPYQVTPEDREIMEQTITLLGERHPELQPAVPGMLQNFRTWYQKDGSYFFYRTPGTRWDMAETSPIVPVTGFDSNTAPGNSGSAVFSGRDHSLIGLLFAGARDSAQEGPYSLNRHEAGVPSTELAIWLKAKGVLH